MVKSPNCSVLLVNLFVYLDISKGKEVPFVWTTMLSKWKFWTTWLHPLHLKLFLPSRMALKGGKSHYFYQTCSLIHFNFVLFNQSWRLEEESPKDFAWKLASTKDHVRVSTVLLHFTGLQFHPWKLPSTSSKAWKLASTKGHVRVSTLLSHLTGATISSRFARIKIILISSIFCMTQWQEKKNSCK